jgi:phosphoglycolate phosphatase-like HAD superfamily hydrolase
MNTVSLAGTDIELVRPIERGRLRYALFDFDGTISLLREGWQQVMGPLMLEMICGGRPAPAGLEEEVAEYISDSTGIQTILQMEALVEMVRRKGLVPASEMLDALGYKAVYNERLMVRVNERIQAMAEGRLSLEEATVRGSLEFVRKLHERGLTMFIFSGTDQDDVRHEAALVGAAGYFKEIWGAINSYKDYNKEKVLKELIAANDLHGSEVLICGDGPVEIRHGRAHDCITLGVASDEVRGCGWDPVKRERLRSAGADILAPDFAESDALLDYLFTG